MKPPDQANGSLQKERIDTYVRVLQQDPKSRVFAPLAVLLAKQDKLYAALGICKRGVATRPGFSDGHLAYAQVLYMLKNHSESLKEIAITLSLDNKKIDAHLLTAQIYKTLGNNEKASLAFQKVLELDPHNELAQQHLIYSTQTDREPKTKRSVSTNHATKILSVERKKTQQPSPRHTITTHRADDHLDLSLSNLDQIQAIIDDYSIRASSQEPCYSNQDLKVPRKPFLFWLSILLFLSALVFGIEKLLAGYTT